MITLLAHAGVEHSSELEAAAHNNVSLLFLVSGATIVTGIAICWLLMKTSNVSIEEEEQE